MKSLVQYFDELTAIQQFKVVVGVCLILDLATTIGFSAYHGRSDEKSFFINVDFIFLFLIFFYIFFSRNLWIIHLILVSFFV